MPKNNIQKEVHRAITAYLKSCDKTPPNNLYQQMIVQVESAMISSVLEYTENNITQTAEILGLSRNTLRKKINDNAGIIK